MNKNLQELINAYPRLMGGEGPRAPGYVGFGWHPIVMRLMAAIDALLDDELAQGFRVMQIKEKFGGLRFYVDLNGRTDFTVDLIGVGRLRIPDQDQEGVSARPAELDRIHELIRAAEREAAITCEVCGAPGELRRDGWLLTLCERHARHRESGGRLDYDNGS